MTWNDFEWLLHVKIRFRPALLDSERLSFKKSYKLCDSAVLCALRDQLASLGRHAQLTRCFSAVVELLVAIRISINKMVQRSAKQEYRPEELENVLDWCRCRHDKGG